MADVTLTRLLEARDIVHIADNMRATDVAEVWALSRHGPLMALMQSIQMTERPWIVKAADGEPLCAFGMVGPVLGNVGSPWMLGTDRLAEHVPNLMRVSRSYMAASLTVYPILRNYVHDENAPAKRYLERLGFTLKQPQVWHTRAMVREFIMERNHV